MSTEFKSIEVEDVQVGGLAESEKNLQEGVNLIVTMEQDLGRSEDGDNQGQDNGQAKDESVVEQPDPLTQTEDLKTDQQNGEGELVGTADTETANEESLHTIERDGKVLLRYVLRLTPESKLCRYAAEISDFSCYFGIVGLDIGGKSASMSSSL